MDLINAFKEKNNIEKSVIIFILFYFVYLFYGLLGYILNLKIFIVNYSFFTTPFFIKNILLFFLTIIFLIKLSKKSSDLDLWSNIFFPIVIFNSLMILILNLMLLLQFYKVYFSNYLIFEIVILLTAIINFSLYLNFIKKNKSNKNKSILSRRFIINTIIVLFFLSFISFPGCHNTEIGFPSTIIQMNDYSSDFFLGDSDPGDTSIIQRSRSINNVDSFLYNFSYNFLIILIIFFVFIYFIKDNMNNKYLNGLKYLSFYILLSFVFTVVILTSKDAFWFYFVIYFPSIILAFLTKSSENFILFSANFFRISFVIGMIIFFLIAYLTANNKVKEANKKKNKDTKNKSTL